MTAPSIQGLGQAVAPLMPNDTAVRDLPAAGNGAEAEAAMPEAALDAMNDALETLGDALGTDGLPDDGSEALGAGVAGDIGEPAAGGIGDGAARGADDGLVVIGDGPLPLAGGVQAEADAPGADAAVHDPNPEEDRFRDPKELPKAERMLMKAVKDMLGSDRAYTQYSIRHTHYGRAKRILHGLTFGIAFSHTRRAYKMQKAQQKIFAAGVMDLQSRLMQLPPNAAAEITVNVGSLKLTVSQSADNRLQASIRSENDVRYGEPFGIPFTARAMTRKMTEDMIRHPEAYPKHALTDMIRTRGPEGAPLSRDIYLTVLQDKYSVPGTYVANLSARTLQTVTAGALGDAEATRESVMAHVDELMKNTAMLQDTCNINDEQAREMLDRLDDARAVNAGRVDDAVDISALTAPRVNPADSEEVRAMKARNTRIHNLVADLLMNYDSSVHDRNLGHGGERIMQTFRDHREAFMELLEGDNSLLDTLGGEIAPKLSPIMDTVRTAWKHTELLTGIDADRRLDTFLEHFPAELANGLEDRIDAAVDEASAVIGTLIRDQVQFIRGAAAPKTTAEFVAAHAEDTPLDRMMAVVDRCKDQFAAALSTAGEGANAYQLATTQDGGPLMFLFGDAVAGLADKGEVTGDMVAEYFAHQIGHPEDRDPNGIVARLTAGTVTWGTDAVLTAALDALDKAAVPLLQIAQRKAPLEAQAKEAVDPNSGYGKFLMDVMENYFDTNDADRIMDRRGMLAAMVRYTRYGEGNDPSEGAVLGALFKGAGPIMQKALQGMDAKTLSPELAEAIGDMKSSLAPIEPRFVEAQLLDIIERSEGRITNITIEKSLGAASVGQAFLCSVTTADRPDEPESCVLKLLRPDVRNRALREKPLFERMALQTNGMELTFRGQLDRIMAELDLTEEADNAMLGKIYESGHGKAARAAAKAGLKPVQSMTVLDKVPPAVNSLLLERAKGRDLASVLQDAQATLADLKQKNADDEHITSSDALRTAQLLSNLVDTHDKLCELSRRWVHEAIFGAGFYHGDLHAGNIMMDLPEIPEIMELKDVDSLPDPGALTVIDYGNATQLTKDQQKNVMVVMAGATFKQTEWFKEGYLNLLPEAEQEKFRALDTIERDAEGYQLNIKGERVYDDDAKPVKITEDGFVIVPEGNGERVTKERVQGRLTAMLDEIIQKGEISDAALRIAVPMTELQQLGIACPAPIFNFSTCQIRLQNTADGMRSVIHKMAIELIGAVKGNESALAADIALRARSKIEAAEGDELKNLMTSLQKQTQETQDYLKTAGCFKSLKARDTFFSVMGDVLGNKKGTFVRNIGLDKGFKILSL